MTVITIPVDPPVGTIPEDFGDWAASLRVMALELQAWIDLIEAAGLESAIADLQDDVGAAQLAITDLQAVDTATASDVSDLQTDVAGLQAKAIYVEKTADEVINNNGTVQDDDLLSLALAAGSVYEAVIMLIYDAAVTADLNVRTTGPSGYTILGSMIAGAVSSTGGTAVGIDIRALNLNSGRVLGGGAVGTWMTALFTGLVKTTGAGTLQIQWAQGVAEVSNTTVRAGSFIRLLKLA